MRYGRSRAHFSVVRLIERFCRSFFLVAHLFSLLQLSEIQYLLYPSPLQAICQDFFAYEICVFVVNKIHIKSTRSSDLIVFILDRFDGRIFSGYGNPWLVSQK